MPESSPYAELARRALAEVTPAETIGAEVDQVDEVDGVVSVRFATTMPGYPGWLWTVSIAHVEGAEPTVLEAELLPGEGALLATEWVPWADRLADLQAKEGESDDEDDDSDDEDEDEDEDDSDDSDDDDDEDSDDDSDDDDSDDDDDDSDDDDDDSDDDETDDAFDGVDVEQAVDADGSVDADGRGTEGERPQRRRRRRR
ncbi:DUF3027 domain-containing protein [Frigoribacterium salinisoli]